jgi:hypothetical protein
LIVWRGVIHVSIAAGTSMRTKYILNKYYIKRSVKIASGS